MDRVPGTTVWVGEGTASRRCNGAWYTPTWGSPVQGSRANCTQEPPFACWDTRTHTRVRFLRNPLCICHKHTYSQSLIGGAPILRDELRCEDFNACNLLIKVALH
ncbi:hypothetical protein CDAR_569521 [Caerostris darwini]|uniref:Uncharacterized protein n=1 Tax=Caerostris darwini TaxID=1538125 RepID=A0AAV4TYY1_9ARAC|nr:hypothetical protein CDAR_569521 [Caerostris darwini]